MQNLRTLHNLGCVGKRVIVRADLDVDISDSGEIKDTTRIVNLIPTITTLFEKGAKQVVILGHRGRPVGFDQNYSLEILVPLLKEHFPDLVFLPHQPRAEFFKTYDDYSRLSSKVVLLDNLRFYEDEEKNDSAFAEELSYFGECFVNEAFATSHREHSSVFALPKIFESKGENLTSVGIQFEKEITNLSKLRLEPTHPILFVISGAKQDKLTYLTEFTKIADHVLVAGRLPEFIGDTFSDPKVTVARLIADKEDITIHSIEDFEKNISRAKTIFVSGPIGKYEEEGHMLGTKRVFEAIANSSAFKVAGGGDTTDAIHKLGLESKFDWISTGGGASLEFLAKGTLPGILQS